MEKAEQVAKVVYWIVGSVGWLFIMAACVKMLRG